MIVVATADFEAYHGLVGELRDRGVTFTTVEPGDPLPEGTEVVVATAADPVAEGGGDDRDGDADGPPVEVVLADPEEPRRAVERALATLRGRAGRTVVGVDPGDRPGVAVLVGGQVRAAFQVPLSETARVVREEVEGAVDPLVRVGDGSRLQGTQVVEELDDVPVELVDETGTTPHLGTGARGMGDVLAAVNIALTPGERTDSVAVEPTAGEIQVVKNRSREHTGTETLPAELARLVALGELDLEEAIERHRASGTDAEADGAGEPDG